MQEVMARGFLTLGTHNISYAHTDEDVDGLSDVYDQVFPILREAVENRAIRQYLKCEPLQPLFRLR
jgi:glutamate-1-semialdehyde 2,1-aminomutase